MMLVIFPLACCCLHIFIGEVGIQIFCSFCLLGLISKLSSVLFLKTIYLLFLVALGLLLYVGLFSSCGARASHCSGFSCCGAWALGHAGFTSCGWNLLGLGIELVSPALAGGSSTTRPPGKAKCSLYVGDR